MSFKLPPELIEAAAYLWMQNRLMEIAGGKVATIELLTDVTNQIIRELTEARNKIEKDHGHLTRRTHWPMAW